MNYVSLKLAALLTLVLTCSVPYYERAEVSKGFSYGGGLGLGGGSFATLRYDMDDPYFCSHIAPRATLFLRHGFSSRTGIFFQVTSGVAYLFPGGFGVTPWYFRPLELADIQLGGKFRLTRRDALRADIGTVYLVAPFLADLTWLHDFDDRWTGAAAAGTRGLSLGFTRHERLSDRLVGHLSLSATFRPNVERISDASSHLTGQLGFALEALARTWRAR